MQRSDKRQGAGDKVISRSIAGQHHEQNPGIVRRRPAVNLKNALIAVTAAAALLGAAVIAVPTTGDRPIGDKIFAKSPR